MSEDFGDKSHESTSTQPTSAICASKPKSLAERLAWMALNLPGFADELAAVREAEFNAARWSSIGRSDCSASKHG